MNMIIDKVEKLSKEDFLNNYLRKNRPVVITDAMEDWDINQFHPESLKRLFGGEYTQVYNDLFDLQNVATLESYLKDNFGQPQKDCKDYIRWYTKLKSVDFLWSDDIFLRMKSAWRHPYFLPTSSYLVPYCDEDSTIDITEARFPYKGLFISGKGARTRLHRDPFNSNAILCQLYGKKDISLYAPSQEKYVMSGKKFVNINNPDLAVFPNFPQAELACQVTLSPGEVILFPAGWFHDVTCVSDSVSITWNFVHSCEIKEFQSFVAQNPDDDQLEIVRFFFEEVVSSEATVGDVSRLLELKFGDKSLKLS